MGGEDRGHEGITLAVLAGGEGSRMGRPKGLMEIDGRPVLAWLLERWGWDGPTLLVTAPGREHPPAWEGFGREVSDPVAGLGPLRGVLTALEHATTPLVVVATVDMPAISARQFAFLTEQLAAMPEKLGVLLARHGPAAAPGVPEEGETIEAGIEPFPSVFRTTAAAMLAGRLAEGRRALHPLARDPRFALVRAPGAWEDEVWTNLNNPAELVRFTAQVRATNKGHGHGER